MICYQNVGQHAKALDIYKRLKKMFSSVLDIGVSPRTEAIYKTLTESLKIGKSGIDERTRSVGKR
jgi:DNA-binding SARP family transcriptional activator